MVTLNVTLVNILNRDTNMNPSTIFHLSSLIVLPAWLLLAAVPNSNITKLVVKSGFLSGLLSLIYIACLSLGFSIFNQGGGFSSLETVKILFSNDWALLAGWVHYLAFDLLIGAHVVEEIKHRHLLIRIVCLFLIFMFGPVGWLTSRIFLKNLKENNYV